MTLKPLGNPSREGSSFDNGSRGAPSPGEAHVSGPVSPNDDLDLLNEDLFRSRESKATGFVEQNSEVQWLRSLKPQMGIASSGRTPYGLTYGTRGTSNETSAQRTDALHTRRDLSNLSSVFHVLDSSVYLDGDDLDVDIMVDPYELPPPETAGKLFNC
jgi:hypothetical protein